MFYVSMEPLEILFAYEIKNYFLPFESHYFDQIYQNSHGEIHDQFPKFLLENQDNYIYET